MTQQDVIALKAKEDAPGYMLAVSPATSCSTCGAFAAKWCTAYDFDANPAWTCDSWQRKPKAPTQSVPAAIPTAEQMPGSFSTFKGMDGRWRWVLKSSNAFEDRQKEVVTRKALERDVQRTDRTGEYGPLRWWHVGNPQWKNPADWRTVVAGKGMDLGTCDFSAMEGPVLIESGTFKSEALGAAIAAKMDQFQASLGFAHPLHEPDRDGLFHHIKRFERSLTPAKRASNPRTGLIVMKERAMDPEKLATFKALIGDDLASDVIGDAQTTTKEARTAGIREKSVDDLEALEQQLAQLTEQVTSFKAAIEEKKAPANTTATNVPVKPETIVAAKAEEEPDGDEGEDMGDEEVYIGDMTGPEFVGLLQQALSPMFESHTKALDLHGKLAAANDAMKEMKSYMGGMTSKDDTLAAMQEAINDMGITLKEAQDELATLNGNVPRELAQPRGATYKASESTDNLIQVPSDTEAGQNLSPLSWVDSFVIQQQQAAASGRVSPETIGVQPSRLG